MGLGDLAAAARVLMAAPAHRRAGLMQAMIGEAALARGHWRRTGRLHPVYGNGTLMSAALAHARHGEGQGIEAATLEQEGDYLSCLAEALEAVIAWRTASGAGGR